MRAGLKLNALVVLRGEWGCFLERAYKIGTVETFTVRRSGRRFYVNLDADTVEAFGIQIGDRLIMKIIEGQHPQESEFNRPAMANVTSSVKSDIRQEKRGERR